jgi:hypothetical protein
MLIAGAAAMAEAVLGTGSALHIIATSREPLRAGANGSIRHNRSPYRRWISGLTTILCVMVPSLSVSSAIVGARVRR